MESSSPVDYSPSPGLSVPPRRLSLPPKITIWKTGRYDGTRRDTIKEFWILPNLRSHPITKGCCARLKISEENLRLLVLGLFMVVYMLFGAVIFSVTERTLRSENVTDSASIETEGDLTSSLNSTLALALMASFIAQHPSVNQSDIVDLITKLMTSSSLNHQQSSSSSPDGWDFPGSFSFVTTTLSTIGYGTATPKTTLGRALLMIYSFFGCTGAILFFNLFLERAITFSANLLRTLRSLRSNSVRSNRTPSIKISASNSSDTDSISVDSLDVWKPSALSVFTCTFVLTVCLMLLASTLYHFVEGWPYFESFYYCYISFATIGFGDFVANQETIFQTYWSEVLYKMFNCLLLLIGCSFVYSLFNIMSMLVRQTLNRLLRKANAFKCHCSCSSCFKRRKCRGGKRHTYAGLGLSERIRLPSKEEIAKGGKPGDKGVISLKDFLAQNKTSMVTLQTRVLQMPTTSAKEAYCDNEFSATTVGPLAIVAKKLNDGL